MAPQTPRAPWPPTQGWAGSAAPPGGECGVINHGQKNFPRATTQWDDSNRGSEPQTPNLGSSPNPVSKAPAPGRAAGSQDTTTSMEGFQDSGYQGRLVQGGSHPAGAVHSCKLCSFFILFLFRASKNVFGCCPRVWLLLFQHCKGGPVHPFTQVLLHCGFTSLQPPFPHPNIYPKPSQGFSVPTNAPCTSNPLGCTQGMQCSEHPTRCTSGFKHHVPNK